MDLPIPTVPQPAAPSQPGAVSPAPGTPAQGADAASEAFSKILAAGLAQVPSPAPDPAADSGEPLPVAPKHKSESPEPEGADAVALLLTVIGLPVAPPSAPVAASPTTMDSASDRPAPAAVKPAPSALRAPANDSTPAPALRTDTQLRAGDEPAAHAAFPVPASGELTHDGPKSPIPELAANPQVLPSVGHAMPQPHVQATPPAEIHTPVHGPDWSTDLGKTLVWMAKGEHSAAEIRLNPPDLGPLEIKLTLSSGDGGQANVAFASPHGAVREAIEAALPQLRDMLAGSGITLGQTSVSAESFRQQGNPGESAPGNAAAKNIEKVDGTGAAPSLRSGVGLIDTFV